MPSRTVQRMVVPTKDEARAAFSSRLAEVITDQPDRPGPRELRGWVAKRYRVSVETARKWLMGLEIPDHTNAVRIATDLKVSLDWLLTGHGQKQPPPHDPLFDTLVRYWRQLTGTQDREEVIRFLRWRVEERLGPESGTPGPIVHLRGRPHP